MVAVHNLKGEAVKTGGRVYDTMEQQIAEEDFWGSIGILLRNYHAINKNVFGTKKYLCYRILNESSTCKNLENVVWSEDHAKFEHQLRDLGLQVVSCEENYLLESLKCRTNEFGILIVTKILPKASMEGEWYNLQIVDYIEKMFLNIPLCEGLASNYPYNIKYDAGAVCSNSLESPSHNIDTANRWCNYVLLPKITKWALFFNEDNKSIQSLQFVDIEEYNSLYGELKKKYGKSIVEIWPENTDPLKHVYEDIAIATYLILLWRRLYKCPNSFVDLGCGNGLLVHILNSEGYNGYGIDIRKRKIWALYPETTKLKEGAVTPNKYDLFAEVDWIIGNHSDELSAWIPVIASRASYNTSYFLLPCCAFELNGRKYQRRDCKFSVYNDFLRYVAHISDECGFLTQIDRLKIPSTKRIAIIGSKRLYLENEHESVCKNVDKFIANETLDVDIKLRNKSEAVQNCTKVDKNIVNEIVLKIFNFLVEDHHELSSSNSWRCGKLVTIPELAQILSKNELQAIKQENGGLKTLLKNNHSVFHVSKNTVKIRTPTKISEKSVTETKIKQKDCFFHLYHPDGCLLNDEDCSFKHDTK